LSLFILIQPRDVAAGLRAGRGRVPCGPRRPH